MLDQAIGASGGELSVTIYWHSLSVPAIFWYCSNCAMLDKSVYHYVICIIRLAISTDIVTNFLFEHWVDTTSHIVNPVKLILKVLNYARKNKYPRNHSALTYYKRITLPGWT